MISKTHRLEFTQKVDLREATMNRMFSLESPYKRESFSKSNLDKACSILDVWSGWVHFCDENPSPFIDSIPPQGETFPTTWIQKIDDQLSMELSQYRSLSEYLTKEAPSKAGGTFDSEENMKFKRVIADHFKKEHKDGLFEIDKVLKAKSGIYRKYDFMVTDDMRSYNSELLVDCIYFEKTGKVPLETVDSLVNKWRDYGRGKLMMISNRDFSDAAVTIAERMGIALMKVNDGGKIASILKMADAELNNIPLKFYTLLPFKHSDNLELEGIKQIILEDHFGIDDEKLIPKLALSLEELFKALRNKSNEQEK